MVDSDGEEEAEVEGARTFLAVRVSAAIITPVSDRAVRMLMNDGGFQALRHSGRDAPGDLSLVAFDDVPWMSMVSPGITTVDQHTDELGRTRARLVVDRIAGSATGRATVRYIEPSAIVRGSAARPRSAVSSAG